MKQDNKIKHDSGTALAFCQTKYLPTHLGRSPFRLTLFISRNLVLLGFLPHDRNLFQEILGILPPTSFYGLTKKTGFYLNLIYLLTHAAKCNLYPPINSCCPSFQPGTHLNSTPTYNVLAYSFIILSIRSPLHPLIYSSLHSREPSFKPLTHPFSTWWSDSKTLYVDVKVWRWTSHFSHLQHDQNLCLQEIPPWFWSHFKLNY